MNTKQTIALILLCVFCLSSCAHNQHAKYTPERYTKSEIYSMLQNHKSLFSEVVSVVSSNQRFYDEGRVSQYTDADIVSPTDKALVYFDEQQQTVIQEFFQLRPYMILFDYSKRFVAISFLSTEEDNGYTIVFWIQSGTNSANDFSDYAYRLSQNFTVEKISNNCLLYFK